MAYEEPIEFSARLYASWVWKKGQTNDEADQKKVAVGMLANQAAYS